MRPAQLLCSRAADRSGSGLTPTLVPLHLLSRAFFHLGLPSRRLPLAALRPEAWRGGSAPRAAMPWCLRKAAALPWERRPVPREWGPLGPGAHLNVLLVGQHQDGDTVQRLACDHLLWGEQRGGSERPLSASAQRSPGPHGPPRGVDALSGALLTWRPPPPPPSPALEAAWPAAHTECSLGLGQPLLICGVDDVDDAVALRVVLGGSRTGC